MKKQRSGYDFVEGQIRLTPLSIVKLSGREKEVFFWVAKEFRNKEIARKLGISVKTVETHKDHIKNKLDLETCQQIFKAAFLYHR